MNEDYRHVGITRKPDDDKKTSQDLAIADLETDRQVMARIVMVAGITASVPGIGQQEDERLFLD
jgi:hypothetical protein